MKKNYCVIDLETAGLSARPESFVFGCLYGENEQGELIKKVFHDRETMIRYIFKQTHFKYIFAHNSEYDFTCLFDNIILNLDHSALFVGSMFIKAKKDGITFMNSLAILKTSVSELGKHSGDYKMQLDDKFKNAKTPDQIKVNDFDIEYCFKDCQIVYDYLVKIFEFTEKLKPTIASCSMEIFVKKFLQRKFFHNKLNEVFRNSYYGGRVECFRFGKINPCFKYDVNSLYPYVCTDMYFPDFNKMKRGNKGTDYFKKFVLKNYEGCAKVKVIHTKNFVGVLPFRKETEIIYPFGTWVAYYNFNELRKAVETGFVQIVKVYEYYYAPKIFFSELSDYMKFFFQKKDTTEGAEKMINKFLLNSLTGKFAQKEHGRKIYFENIHDAQQYLNTFRTKQKFKIHHFNEHRDDLFLEMFKKDRNKNVSRWNIPTISSYITSQSRIFMLDFYLKYQDSLCYTDTDSLVLSKPMNEVSGNGLGQFKKEKDEQIDIIGNKHYHTKIGRKKFKMIKGVHKKHTKHKGKFVFTRMIRTKESINRNLHAGMFIKVEKEMSNDYTKRSVIKNKTLTLKINET